MHQIRQKKPKPSKRNATNSSIAPTSGARSTSALVDRAARSTIVIDDCLGRSTIAPRDLVDCDCRLRRSLARCDRWRSGVIWALSSLSLSLWSGLSLLSLSLSFSRSYLKWKWGEKLISGSKVKILVNRKSFSGKWYFPWQPNMRKRVKMISWNHFHPKQTHPQREIVVRCWFGTDLRWAFDREILSKVWRREKKSSCVLSNQLTILSTKKKKKKSNDYVQVSQFLQYLQLCYSEM